MSDTTFDVLSYVRSAPVISIESGILLARTLVSVMPRSMPAHVKRAATKATRVADNAQAALTRRQQEQGQPLEETARELDIAADQVWSALYDLLDALARLPAKYERSQKARKLLATLFPERTSFLRLTYNEQFVTMDTILKRIDDEGHAKTLDAVVGPEPLQEIRASHPRYQAMVTRRLKEAAPADSLLDHVRNLQRALLEYATAVVSTVDSDDPATLTTAREALRPLDNHRDQQTNTKPDPTTPTPDPSTPTPDPQAPAPIPPTK